METHAQNEQILSDIVTLGLIRYLAEPKKRTAAIRKYCRQASINNADTKAAPLFKIIRKETSPLRVITCIDRAVSDLGELGFLKNI